MNFNMRSRRKLSSTGAILLAGMLVLSGCGGLPGPSVPFQPGANLAAARTAVSSCAQFAPRGGNGAVTGSYIAGFLLGGILLGPIVVASNQSDIRAQGEAHAVDKCLGEQGFKRRDLTPAEIQVLNRTVGSEREILLDHLIGGGSLDTYRVS